MLDTAVAAVRAAGRIQRERYGTILNVDEAKRNDVKLEVDRLCEAAILRTIRAKFPDHAVLAEESGAGEGAAEFRWIVDPLDGTVNFFYGIPYFCSSVACYRKPRAGTPKGGLAGLGEPVAAAIYVPPLDELFAAEAGRGATLNGRPIRASAATTLADSIVATGFGSREENVRRMFAVTESLAGQVRKLRCLGAAAYDLANVACGRLTGFYERGIRSWDIAAGALVIREAGGRIDAREFEPETWDVLASGAGMHDAFRAAVDRV